MQRRVPGASSVALQMPLAQQALVSQLAPSGSPPPVQLVSTMRQSMHDSCPPQKPRAKQLSPLSTSPSHSSPGSITPLPHGVSSGGEGDGDGDGVGVTVGDGDGLGGGRQLPHWSTCGSQPPVSMHSPAQSSPPPTLVQPSRT